MQPQLQSQPSAALNPFAGLITIFYSPADTFAVPQKRGWLVPLLAACLLTFIMNAAIVQRVGLGTIVRNQLESNTSMAERLGPDGIAQAVERAETSSVQQTLTYVAPPIAVAVILAAMAGITLGLLLAAGGITKYSAVLTSGAWTMYAIMAVTCAGSLATVYSMSDFQGVDLQRVFALNAGMFAQDSSPVTRALLSGIDLLAFWGIFINTVGLTKLSERVSTGLALGVLILLHVVFTGIRAGWAAMFG